MLRQVRVAMVRLTSLDNSGPRRWCTAIVLLAVCALTLSVATRYGNPEIAPDQTRTVAVNDQAWTPGLQRLLNNATTWIPPLIIAVLFQDPGYCPQISQPPTPVVSSVLLERNLYNRPPPSSPFLS